LETMLIKSLVEALSYGYEEDHNSIIKRLAITHKTHRLNISSVKREDNLKKWVDEQDPERIIYVDNRTFLFIDKNDGILYAVTTESNRRQLIRKLKNDGLLTCITSLIYLRNDPIEKSPENSIPLFDDRLYEVDTTPEEFHELAQLKAQKILEEYGEYINQVSIIARENTSSDTPKIKLYDYAKNGDLIHIDDWSKYLPTVYIENSGEGSMSNPQSNKSKEKKHAKLKRNIQKLE